MNESLGRSLYVWGDAAARALVVVVERPAAADALLRFISCVDMRILAAVLVVGRRGYVGGDAAARALVVCRAANGG